MIPVNIDRPDTVIKIDQHCVVPKGIRVFAVRDDGAEELKVIRRCRWQVSPRSVKLRGGMVFIQFPKTSAFEGYRGFWVDQKSLIPDYTYELSRSP